MKCISVCLFTRLRRVYPMIFASRISKGREARLFSLSIDGDLFPQMLNQTGYKFFFMKPMEIRIHQFSFPYSFPLKPSFSTTQTDYNDCIYCVVSEAPNISSHFPKHITKKEQHYWKKKPLIMFNRIIIQIHPQLILTSYFLFLIRI